MEKAYLMIMFDTESNDLLTFRDFLFNLNFGCLSLQNVITLAASIQRFIFRVMNLFITAFLGGCCLSQFHLLLNEMFPSWFELVYLLVSSYFPIIF